MFLRRVANWTGVLGPYSVRGRVSGLVLQPCVYADTPIYFFDSSGDFKPLGIAEVEISGPSSSR